MAEGVVTCAARDAAARLRPPLLRNVEESRRSRIVELGCVIVIARRLTLLLIGDCSGRRRRRWQAWRRRRADDACLRDVVINIGRVYNSLCNWTLIWKRCFAMRARSPYGRGKMLAGRHLGTRRYCKSRIVFLDRNRWLDNLFCDFSQICFPTCITCYFYTIQTHAHALGTGQKTCSTHSPRPNKIRPSTFPNTKKNLVIFNCFFFFRKCTHISRQTKKIIGLYSRLSTNGKFPTFKTKTCFTAGKKRICRRSLFRKYTCSKKFIGLLRWLYKNGSSFNILNRVSRLFTHERWTKNVFAQTNILIKRKNLYVFDSRQKKI